MTIRCPACRAENPGGPQCRRCRADLSLLLRLEEQRAKALATAAQCVAQGDGSAAARLAGHAHWLRRGDDSARLLALGRLLRRDFAGAVKASCDANSGSRY